MKAAILAGGRGERLGAISGALPKALVPLVGKPIIQHVIEGLHSQGVAEFVVALGHQGAAIKRWLFDLIWLDGNVTADFDARTLSASGTALAGSRITLVETGDGTPKGTRLARLAQHLGSEAFLLAYCDGLSDIDVPALATFHAGHGRAVTIVGVQGRSPYGVLALDGDEVSRLDEKPLDPKSWISAGIFVVSRSALSQVGVDDDWETGALQRLTAAGEVMVYRHRGRWTCIDTPKDWAVAERFLSLSGEHGQ